MSKDQGIIHIENAAFSYEDNNIFHNISININEGELYCLMGRNGCGKSTLLDCVLGVNVLKTGKINIYGKEVSTYKVGELAKKLSYVPQIHNKSFPYLVRQVVLMGRSAYIGRLGRPHEKDYELVENIMKEVGVMHLADRPYTQISGGEMQMVALARALVQETSIIIMDEPTAHLDFYNEMLFLEKVMQLSCEGKSILMSTHSPNQAFYMENHGLDVKVGLMDNGIIFAEGAPGEVLNGDNIAKVYHTDVKIIQDVKGKQIMPLGTI